MWKSLFGLGPKTPANKTEAIEEEVHLSDSQDCLPAFSIPILYEKAKEKQAKEKNKKKDDMERFFGGENRVSPYFSNGVFDLIGPSNVDSTPFQSLYSTIPVAKSESQFKEEWLTIQATDGSSIVLDLYYSRVLSMRHNEVRLRYIPNATEKGKIKALLEEPYMGGDSYVILALISAHRRNNIPDLVEKARELSPTNRFFKLLEIPLQPKTRSSSHSNRNEGLIDVERERKVVNEVEMGGIPIPEYIATLILSQVSSLTDLYNMMQVNSDFDSLINNHNNTLWRHLCGRLLDIDTTTTTTEEKEEREEWRVVCKNAMTSKLTLVMKVKEDEPEDIEALLLDVRVGGRRIVKAHQFTDWRADDEAVYKFTTANPGYID